VIRCDGVNGLGEGRIFNRPLKAKLIKSDVHAQPRDDGGVTLKKGSFGDHHPSSAELDIAVRIGPGGPPFSRRFLGDHLTQKQFEARRPPGPGAEQAQGAPAFSYTLKASHTVLRLLETTWHGGSKNLGRMAA